MSEEPAQPTAWHCLPADEAATRLTASFDEGLADDEVASRRAQHGENRITPRPGKGPLLRFALQFVQPLVVVLLLAGVVTAILGEWMIGDETIERIECLYNQKWELVARQSAKETRPAKVASRPSRHAGRWPRSPPASASSRAKSTLGAEGHGRFARGWTTTRRIGK